MPQSPAPCAQLCFALPRVCHLHPTSSFPRSRRCWDRGSVRPAAVSSGAAASAGQHCASQGVCRDGCVHTALKFRPEAPSLVHSTDKEQQQRVLDALARRRELSLGCGLGCTVTAAWCSLRSAVEVLSMLQRMWDSTSAYKSSATVGHSWSSRGNC